MKKSLKLLFKGFLMGTADIIPGISGGTVALLLGIYEEFIGSLANIDIKFLLRLKIKKFISTINLEFFVPLFLGIVLAVFSLSHLLSWLISNYPVYLWSLFFGLVLSSVLVLLNEYKCYEIKKIIFVLLGIGTGILIATIEAINFPENSLFLVFGGMLASMAMILPGISGSYILVLIGLYKPVLSYVKDFNFVALLAFVLGVGLGILFGSKVLKRLLGRYPSQVYSVLFGFILGSLSKIWPWHSVSGSLELPDPSSLESLVGLVVMILSAIFIGLIMKQANK